MSHYLAQCITSVTSEFTLDNLIDEVNEEIKMRRYVYANQVLNGIKTKSVADRKIAAMEKVAYYLACLRDSHIIRTEMSIHGHPILIECQGMFSPYRAENLKNELKLIFEKANDNGDRF